MRKSYAEYDMDGSREEEEDELFVQKLANRPCVLFCVYCGLIGYSLFGIIFDWLWAWDMLQTETGLVFGPPRTVTIAFLFIIASIGMVAFLLEMISFSLKVFKGKPLMDEDLAQVLTLFLEEVPSITLNLLLAQCREVPMSYYALAKAALQMVGSFFRVIRMVLRYFNKDKHRFQGVVAWMLRTFVFVTCIYCCIAAVLVWVFTYTTPPDEGGDFRPPGSLWEKSYDNGRYFYKSGVYFSHPSFASCNNSMPWNETRVNWLKFDSIGDILQTDETAAEVKANFYYNDTATILIVENPVVRDQSQCYVTTNLADDPSNCIITPQATCSKPDLEQTQMQLLSFSFRTQERTKTLVFGDIKFKASWSYLDDSGGVVPCQELDVDEWGFLYDEMDRDIKAQIQYFQMIDKNLNDTYSYYEEIYDSGEFRHYQLDYELANVTDVWLTGYDKCPMTGSLSPNWDDEGGINNPDC